MYQDNGRMNHFVTTKEEDDIPTLIGPNINFGVGSPKFLDNVNHEEEEMVLDEFQVEELSEMFPYDDEVFSIPFEYEYSLDHVIDEEENPTCDEPLKYLKEES
ncbi:hypothetical protein KI387_015247, partial [Taxus chinensis]